jgi:uncharacterized protein YjbJ (UPF0337 family)
MLWTIAVLLLILWLLGMVSSYTLGGFIHILLVLAIITVLIRVIQGRSPVAWRRSTDGSEYIELEKIMDKDRVEGKVKDIAGRAQRQAGEWTGDTETQAKGAAKQAEGKVQNAWGKAKDAVKKSSDRADDPETSDVEDEESAARRRRAS